jgi:nitrogen-specific signal transduction histidine kinase
MEDRPIGAAFSIQDLSELKKLEEEKLEAERLAAVGQTVAGLAHGVKNLTAALEGGMYMLSTGIEKGELDRIQNQSGGQRHRCLPGQHIRRIAGHRSGF